MSQMESGASTITQPGGNTDYMSVFLRSQPSFDVRHI